MRGEKERKTKQKNYKPKTPGLAGHDCMCLQAQFMGGRDRKTSERSRIAWFTLSILQTRLQSQFPRF